jgi:hypothetical protein
MPKTDFIRIKPRAEDRAWLLAQAEALGLDDPALALTALLRWAQRTGVTLAVASSHDAPRPQRPTGSNASPPVDAYEAAPLDELAGDPGLPIDESAVDHMVATRLAEAEANDALAPPPAPPQRQTAAVFPLVLNASRGYLRGSAAIPAGAGQ